MMLLLCVWSRNVRSLKRVSGLSSRILGGDADQINMKEVKKVIEQLDREKRIEWVFYTFNIHSPGNATKLKCNLIG